MLWFINQAIPDYNSDGVSLAPPPHLFPPQLGSTHKLQPRVLGVHVGERGKVLRRSNRDFWVEGGAARSNTRQCPLPPWAFKLGRKPRAGTSGDHAPGNPIGSWFR